MKKILLATDLEANSDRAMERALKTAQQQGAVLHIIHVLPLYKAKSKGLTFKKEAQQLIKAIFAEEFPKYKNVDIKIEVVESKEAYAKILEYADKIKADIIIMGLHGKTKFRDLFVGTTVERVIRKGHRPVLMVKNKAIVPYDSVISAIDFAPASRNALRLAMNTYPKANFIALHAYKNPQIYPTSVKYAEQINESAKKENKKVMTAFMHTEESHYKKEHGKKIGKLDAHLHKGNPYNQLIKHAKKYEANLITIGAHGKSMITPSKIGGVAEDILANPPCDVLVVRE
jgi:nucleotide-binding universal stress UspA family protein